MKKINPLYLLALLVTVLIISITSIKDLKTQIIESNNSFNELKVKAVVFKDYKNIWINEKEVLKTLDKIKKTPMFKSDTISYDVLNNTIKIDFKTVNQKNQNNFLNMVLNSNFIIKKMNLNKENLSLEVGIK